jgi:hypothetical protein
VADIPCKIAVVQEEEYTVYVLVPPEDSGRQPVVLATTRAGLFSDELVHDVVTALMQELYRQGGKSGIEILKKVAQ